MRRWHPALVVLVVAFGWVIVAAAQPAAAHAVLQSTSPSDGAQLEQAPDSVVLTFSEDVSAPSGALRVIDADGEQVDDGAVVSEGVTVQVGLPDDLGEGAYIASYSVVSADGHPISGALSFTVGDATPVDPAQVASLAAPSSKGWDIAAGVARFFAYLGALLAAGGAVYRATVDRDAPARWPHTRLVRIAAAIGALGAIAVLPITAHVITGDGPGSLLDDGVANVVLGDGVGPALMVTLLGLATIVLGLVPTMTRRPLVLGVGAFFAAGSFALTGHTNTSDPRWLVTLADLVHVLAAAIWFGGLVLLARSLRRAHRPDSATDGAEVVARFSTVAGIAIITVGVAGSVLSWSEVASLANVTGTSYGRLLLVKLAIVAAIAAVAVYNRSRLVPAVTRADGDGAGWRTLRRTTAVEAVAMVAVLAVTAGLVNVTPGRAQLDDGPASVIVPFADGNLNVVVDPAEAGFNQIHLYVLDPTGRPVDLDFDDLTVELSLPASDIGPIRREPFVAGPGHFQLDGTDLSVPGTWEIEVIARISTFDQERVATEVTIRP